MKKLSSYEKVMRELTKMKKQYDKQEANKEAREVAKNERAAIFFSIYELFHILETMVHPQLKQMVFPFLFL